MAYTLLLGKTPALACSSHSAVFLSCDLVIKYSTNRKQAAIIISLSTHTCGFDNAQLFVLTYNANNLVPDRTFLGPAPEDLPQDQLSGIARRSAVDSIKTLHLALREPCHLRCPPSTGSIAPKQGHELPFRQLRDLASSTEVRIVFDDNWVHEKHHAVFYCLINHPNRFAGIPVENYNGPSSRQIDWTIFSPVDDAELEAPPSYNNVPAKRQSTTSPPPRLPPAKRERARYSLESQPERYLTEPAAPSSPGFGGSPTEKATLTTASPSPCFPSSPYKNMPDSQDAMKTTLEALLPEVLHKIMPEVLAGMFAVPPPSPASDPAATSSIGSLISARIAADVESIHSKTVKDACIEAVKQMSTKIVRQACAETLKEMHTSMLDNASDLRDVADAKFHEELHEHKLDLTVANEEGLEEIRRGVDSAIEELEATAAEIVARSGAELQEHADDVYLEVWDKLSGMKDVVFIQRERKALDEKGYLPAGQPPASNLPAGSGPRAISLPL